MSTLWFLDGCRVTRGLEQQLCCDRFLEVKVTNEAWR